LAPDLPQAGLLERSAAQPERLFALIATPAGVLHRSDDLGATWTSADRLESPLLQRLAAWLSSPRPMTGGFFQTVRLDVSDSDPDRIAVTEGTFSLAGARFSSGLSRDGGATWSLLSTPGDVVLHPTDESVLYAAATEKLWISRDEGLNWTETALDLGGRSPPVVLDTAEGVRVLSLRDEVRVSDEDGSLLSRTPLPEGTFDATIDRGGNVHALAGASANSARLWLSDDFGATFLSVSPPLDVAVDAEALGISNFFLEADGDRVVVFGRGREASLALLHEAGGLEGWIDGSAFEPEFRLTPLPSPTRPSPRAGFLARMPRAPTALDRLGSARLESGALALWGYGPPKEPLRDQAQSTWSSLDSGITWQQREILAASRADARRLYLREGGILQRSDDEGQTVQTLGVSLSDADGPGSRLVTDPTDPETVLALSAAGIDVSTDAGLTWDRLLEGAFIDLDVVNVGSTTEAVVLAADLLVRVDLRTNDSTQSALPEGATPRQLHLPVDGGSRWIVATALGALVSDDLGSTWRSVDLRLLGALVGVADAGEGWLLASNALPESEQLLWSSDEGQSTFDLGLLGEVVDVDVADDLIVASIDGYVLNGQQGVFAWQRSDGFPCVQSAEQLCLQHDRFRVQVRWQLAQGAATMARTRPMTSDTGAFWFFEEDNLELVLKVLDGCAVNGHFWVFAAGLTDVGVEIDVIDQKTLEQRSYSSSFGVPFGPLQDVEAFRCDGESLQKGDFTLSKRGLPDGG
ncbi:MAG: hypothetical protein AAF690_29750, partial [Acidobacteriota bacterium]